MADREGARRLGRRAGIAVHALIVGGFTAVWGTQILIQVWAPDTTATDLGCEEGIQALFHAVERARGRASEARGEDEALRAFRRSLEPEWAARAALGARCQGAKGADLAVLDRLRYAEEAAVRRESTALAPLRREVARRLGVERP